MAASSLLWIVLLLVPFATSQYEDDTEHYWDGSDVELEEVDLNVVPVPIPAPEVPSPEVPTPEGPSPMPTAMPHPSPTDLPSAAPTDTPTDSPTEDECAPIDHTFCADAYADCAATECQEMVVDIARETFTCSDMQDCFHEYYGENATLVNDTLVDAYFAWVNLTECITDCVDPTPYEPRPVCPAVIASICADEYRACASTDCGEVVYGIANEDFHCYSEYPEYCYMEYYPSFTPNETDHYGGGYGAWLNLTHCLTTCVDPVPYIPAPRPEPTSDCNLYEVCAEPMFTCEQEKNCSVALGLLLSTDVVCDPYEELSECWERMGFSEFDPSFEHFRQLMWCWECCEHQGEDAFDECVPCDGKEVCLPLLEECFANDICGLSLDSGDWVGNPEDYEGRRLFEDIGRCYDCCSWPSDERYYEGQHSSGGGSGGSYECGIPSEDDYCYQFEFEFHCTAQLEYCERVPQCWAVYQAISNELCRPDDCWGHVHGPNATASDPGYEEFSLLVSCHACCEQSTDLGSSRCGQCPQTVLEEVCAPYFKSCDENCNQTFAELYNLRELPESRDEGEVPSGGPNLLQTAEGAERNGSDQLNVSFAGDEYKNAVELEMCSRCCGSGGDALECTDLPRVCYDFEEVCSDQILACVDANDTACPGFFDWYLYHPTPFVIEQQQNKAKEGGGVVFPIGDCLDLYPASFCVDAEPFNNLIDCFSCCFEGNAADNCTLSDNKDIQSVYLVTKSDKNVDVRRVPNAVNGSLPGHFEANVANVDEEFAIFFDIHFRARVSVNGTDTVGGYLAGIPLNVGMNVFNVTVAAANGDSMSMILIVIRAGNSEARLLSLRVNTGNDDVELDPAFLPNRQFFYASLPNELSTVSFIVQPLSDDVQSFDVNGSLITRAVESMGDDGQPLVEYASDSMAVPVGETVFMINVTAQDGASRTYGVLIYREDIFCDGHAALGDFARPKVIGQSCQSREPVDGSCDAQCLSGFVYASGDELRTCLQNGSFTGEPYTCAPLFDRPDAPTIVLDRAATMAIVTWQEVDVLGGPTIDEYRLSYRLFDAVNRTYPFNGTELTTTITLPLMSAFFFYVEACSSLGCRESRRSNLFQTPGAPSAPVIRQLEYDEALDMVTFEWREPFDDGGASIMDFTVQTRNNDGIYGDFADENTTKTLLEIAGADRGIVLGEQYYYQVRANNDAGLSGPYRERSFRTPDPPEVPGAPYITRGITIGTDSVYLAWDVVDDGGERITRFYVEYRIIGSGSDFEMAWSGDAKRAVVSDLLDAEFYEFQVIAENSVGFSAPSTTVQLQTFAASPPPPTNVSVSAITATTMEVMWLAPSSITRPVVEYRVDIARVLGGAAPLVWNPFVRTEDEGTVVEFLQPNTEYHVRVLARNALSGFGNASDATPFATLVRAPDTPRAFRVFDREATSVTTIWNDFDSNVDYYVIEMQEDGDMTGSWTVLDTNATTPYDATSLTRSTTYHFRLCAHNTGGASGYRTLTTKTLAELPTSPNITDFHLDIVTESDIVFSWAAPDDGGAQILAYLVRPREGGTTGTVQVALSTSLALTGLTENTAYGFEVAAVNRIGLGAFSAAFNVTTLAARPMISSFTASGAGDHVLTYSAGDTLTIAFDMDTNQTGTRTEAEINEMFDFSFDVGTLFAGSWTTASTFVITAATLPTTDGPLIGTSDVELKGDGSILNAAGTSLAAIGKSPVLMGNFGEPAPTSLSGAIIFGSLPTINEDSNVTQVAAISINETAGGNLAALQVAVTVSNGVFASGTREYTTSVTNVTNINDDLATSLFYQPDGDFFGSDAFSVTLYNDSVVVDTFTQVFTVVSDPDPPSFIEFGDIDVPFGTEWVDIYDGLFGVGELNVTEINGNNAVVELLDSPGANGIDYLIDADSEDGIVYLWAPVGELSFSGEPVEGVDYTPNFPGADPDPVVIDAQGEEMEPELESWGSTIELSGPIDAVNEALRQLHYRSTANEIGEETLFLVAEDYEDDSLVVVTSIAIEFECAASTEAPEPMSAQLRDNLLGFIVHFSAPLWSSASQVDCADIFSDATASALGDGSACIVIASQLRVRFGAGATLEIGDAISFAEDNGLRRCPEGMAVTGVVFLEEPDDAVVPMVDIAAPSSIGLCDDITIRARKIGGFGGRGAVFIWGSPDGILPTVTSETQAFIINSVDLAPGTTYEITLTALNFLGVASDEVVFTFDVSSLPLPGLAPQGATYIEASSGEMLRLTVAARLSTCVSQEDNRMQFEWSVSPNVTLDAASSMSPSLLVDTSALMFETEYTFTVSGSMTTDSSLSNTVAFVVVVEYSDLVAVIGGGSYAEVGQGSDVVLDAGDSIDPDNTSDPFEFTWACETAAEGPCLNRSSQLLDPIALPDDETVTIASGILSPDTYVFSLSATKPGRNTAEDQVVRNLVFGDPPEVTIEVLSPITRADSGTVIAGHATDGSGLPLAYEWSVVGSSLLFPLGSLVLDVTVPILVIPDPEGVDIFTPGSEIVFQLTVTAGEGGVSSSAQVSMYVPAKPSGGQVTLSPDTGEALGTEFTIEFSGWESPVGRLVYAVAVLLDGTARFLVSPTASEQATFTIPSTAVTTLRACIIDPSAAFTCVDLDAVVTELSEPVFGFARDAMGRAQENFENLGSRGDIISAARTFALAASDTGTALLLLQDGESDEEDDKQSPGPALPPGGEFPSPCDNGRHSCLLSRKKTSARKMSLAMKQRIVSSLSSSSSSLLQSDEDDDRLALFESILDSVEMFAGDVAADESIPSLENVIEGFWDLITDEHLAQTIDIMEDIVAVASPEEITATELTSLLMITDFLLDSYDYFDAQDDLSTFYSQVVRLLESLNGVSATFASTILEFAGEFYNSPIFDNVLSVDIFREVFSDDDGSGVGFEYYLDDTINPDGDTYVTVPAVDSTDTSTFSAMLFSMNFFDDTLMGSAVLNVAIEKAVASVSTQIEFEVMIPFSYQAEDCGVGEESCEPECQMFDYATDTWTTDDVVTVPTPILAAAENVTVTCQVYVTEALVAVQAVPAQPALTDASLSDVEIDPILSVFEFDPTDNFTQVLDYEIEVERLQETVDILPTIRENTGASLARVLVNDVELADFDVAAFDGVTPFVVDLMGFDLATVVIIEVVAQDLVTTVNYTFTFEHSAGSQDNSLSSIVPDLGTLSPPFSSNVLAYTLELPFQEPNVSFTVGHGDDFQTLTSGVQFGVAVNVADGAATPTFELVAPTRATSSDAFSESETVIEFVVTAQDEAFVQTYTVTVTRLAPQTVSSLSSLTLGDIIGSISFSGSTLSYAPTVRFSLEEIAVTSTVSASSYATIAMSSDGTGDAALDVSNVTSGSEVAVPLTTGASTLLSIVVTAQSGDVSTTYTVSFQRQTAQSLNQLSALDVEDGSALSPSFVASTFAYEVHAPFSEAVIDVTPGVNADDGSSMFIGATSETVASGEVYAWTPGPNGTVLTLRVVAEDDAEQDYTLAYVQLPASANSSLCDIAFDAADLQTTDNALVSETTFSMSTLNYTIYIPFGATSFSFEICLSSGRTAVVSQGGTDTAIVDGEDFEITTTAGTVVNFDIVVTAEDGVSTTTYGIVVDRPAAEANNLLSSIVASAGAIAPTFVSTTNDYALTVDNAIDEVSLTITPEGTFSTYSVALDSVTQSSATASFDVALATATLRDSVVIVTISVTSEAGVANVYTVTVTREKDGIERFISNIVATPPAFFAEDFTTTKREYELTIPFGLTCADVTFSYLDTDVTLFDTNNNSVVSALAAHQICISTGTRVVIEERANTDNFTLYEYQFDVSIAQSFSDTRILSLAVSEGILAPAFDPFTYAYTVSSVPFDVGTMTVTPTVDTTNNDELRNVDTLAPLTSGEAYDVDVTADNTTLAIRVRSLDGSEAIYTFIITHVPAQTINTLTSLEIDEFEIAPTFAPATLMYTAEVDFGVSSVNVVPTADAEFLGTVDVGVLGSTLVAATSGAATAVSLAYSADSATITVIEVLVTAQSFDSRSYQVAVTRQIPSSNVDAAVDITLANGDVTALAYTAATAGNADSMNVFMGTVTTSSFNVTMMAEASTSVVNYGTTTPANSVTVAVEMTASMAEWMADFEVESESGATKAYHVHIVNSDTNTVTPTSGASNSFMINWHLLFGALTTTSVFALLLL